MTIGQMIFLFLIFSIDVGRLWYLHNHQEYTEDREWPILDVIRVCLVYAILISSLLGMYSLQKGCPQYEKIENAYRIK